MVVLRPPTKETTMTKLSSVSLLLLSFLATPALAAPEPGATYQVIVRTTDLDLASAAGQRQLDRRLVHAVIDVCGAASDVDLAGSNAVRRCRDDTRARIAAERERIVELARRAVPIVLAAR